LLGAKALGMWFSREGVLKNKTTIEWVRKKKATKDI
jgi:hypothetical protein